MNIRDRRTVKAQMVSGLWLAVKAVLGLVMAMAVLKGWALLRGMRDPRDGSAPSDNLFVFGMCLIAAIVVLVVAAVRWRNSPAKVMRIPDSIYLPVRNLDAASEWYRDKLGCYNLVLSEDDEPGTTAALALEKESGIMMLGVIDPKNPGTDAAEPSVPTLYAGNINKAREWLVSRGVAAGPMQRDQQHTQYFEFRDLDGNLLEVSEEP